MRKVLPLFLDKGKGTILNIGSAASVFGTRAGFAYTASKHAVAGMTKNAGHMYAKKKVFELTQYYLVELKQTSDLP